MGDLSDTETANINLGIKKSASLKDLCKSHKFHIMKWHHNHDHHPTTKPHDKPSFIKKTLRGLSIKKREESNNTFVNNNDGDDQHEPKTPRDHHHKKKPFDILRKQNFDDQELVISSPKLLSRTTSWISPFPSPNLPTNLPPSIILLSDFQESSSGASAPSSPKTPRRQQTFLSKTASGRNMTTPIFFSQSAARKKPPPVEKKLECTLEDLCFGCVKKINITRDAISSSGLIVQEEDTLSIKVKPGWKNGTKIVFEGKGDERPGSLPADIIFAIDEKIHPLFERKDDDLEVGVEVPLVQALTGCTISVPLLGGEELDVYIDDIIYPGYEKIVLGQGMPKSSSKEDGMMMRGDLRLKFMVEFPDDLSDRQRSEVVSILQECS